ncbi:hypothetical protein SLEP1_g16367 [Rubroshorea leprosula]|uniref:Uncharacterized protein n=1 Tax=Rubroshorea leprosula TaxID=152421 RepID=A0AAV5IQK9_9ROSI|nr:hypothetical protein SLEP1_g16367 [Rubroshorea leprosula]
MALLMQETPKIDHLENTEVQEFYNSAILMSFLEESHSDDEYYNDEELNSLMQSLQEEINAKAVEPELNVVAERVEGGVSMDFEGFGRSDDDMEVVPSSPSEDMNWYMGMEGQAGEMEFGAEFFYQTYYCGVTLEELQYSSSLWQETYDATMYN